MEHGWLYTVYTGISMIVLTPCGLDGKANILQMIFWKVFVKENFGFELKSLEYIPDGVFGDKSALVEAMAWRRTGDKPFTESMLSSILIMWHHKAPLGLH